MELAVLAGDVPREAGLAGVARFDVGLVVGVYESGAVSAVSAGVGW